MARVSKAFLKKYWFVALVFSVLLGEIILPSLVGHPLPLLENPAAMIAYYALLSLILGLVVARMGIRWGMGVFFIYGVLAELVLFKNITGVTDIKGVVFFGLLYVFLFGVPYVVVKRWLD